MLKVGMRSLATSVKGQGVGTAYAELIDLLTKYGKDDIFFTHKGLRDCDLLHCHTLDPVSFFWLKRSKVPTIASVHMMPETMNGSLHFPKPVQKLFNAYMLSFYRSADYMHIVHPDTAEVLEKYGVSRDRIFWVPNVVSADGVKEKSSAKREELRKKHGFEPSDFVVMGSGQLQSRKGILDFAECARKLPDVKFIWAGGFSFGALSDGHKELKELVDNPPENLNFLGIIEREEVYELLIACDLFFLPSFHEQFSMSILEAAAAGAPLLLRDLAPYRTVYGERYLHGENAEEFTEHIRKLKSDREFQKKMALLSAEINEMYSEPKIYEKWKQAYSKFASQKRPDKKKKR